MRKFLIVLIFVVRLLFDCWVWSIFVNDVVGSSEISRIESFMLKRSV